MDCIASFKYNYISWRPTLRVTGMRHFNIGQASNIDIIKSSCRLFLQNQAGFYTNHLKWNKQCPDHALYDGGRFGDAASSINARIYEG